jgi:hypothetical protein
MVLGVFMDGSPFSWGAELAQMIGTAQTHVKEKSGPGFFLDNAPTATLKLNRCSDVHFLLLGQ